MNKARILTCIITKSHKRKKLIKGPNYFLSCDQAKKMIKYLKNEKRWNYTYLANNACIIDNDTLFHKLKLFPLSFNNNRYLYDLSIVNVSNYFQIDTIDAEADTTALVIKSKETNEHCANWLFSKVYTTKIEKYLSEHDMSLENEIQISKSLLNDFFKTRFDEYFDPSVNIYLRKEKLANYIFRENESWFKLRGNHGYIELNWMAG